MTATVSYPPTLEEDQSSSPSLRMSSTDRLMEEAARLRTVSGIDRDPASRPRIPAVTAPVFGIPAQEV